MKSPVSKRMLRRYVPNLLIDQLRKLSANQSVEQKSAARVEANLLPEWEFKEHWISGETAPAGWNVQSIAEAQIGKWPAFVSLLEGSGPLGISHEAAVVEGRENLWAHNLLMSYGYCAALAACSANRLKMLDWGGGLGHYYLLTRALLPGIDLDYYCQDVPVLCRAGRQLLPQAHFFEEPNACFSDTYDFIHAGSSLWYVENWNQTVARLARATKGYLYVTRMLFAEGTESFVAVQRPQKYGYNTEYQCWVLSRRKFLEQMEEQNMVLVREFYFGEGPQIHGAPEKSHFRGFLFRVGQ